MEHMVSHLSPPLPKLRNTLLTISGTVGSFSFIGPVVIAGVVRVTDWAEWLKVVCDL